MSKAIHGYTEMCCPCGCRETHSVRNDSIGLGYILSHRLKNINGSAHPSFKGKYGLCLDSTRGRWVVFTRDRRQIRWTRVIMQNETGQELTRHEVVHHVNGVKTDDRVENLRVMDKREHARLHALSGDYYGQK